MGGSGAVDGFATQGVVGAENHFRPRVGHEGFGLLVLEEDVGRVVTEGEGELVTVEQWLKARVVGSGGVGAEGVVMVVGVAVVIVVLVWVDIREEEGEVDGGDPSLKGAEIDAFALTTSISGEVIDGHAAGIIAPIDCWGAGE